MFAHNFRGENKNKNSHKKTVRKKYIKMTLMHLFGITIIRWFTLAVNYPSFSLRAILPKTSQTF